MAAAGGITGMVVDWTRRSRRSSQNLSVVEAMSVACPVTDTLSAKETNRQTGQLPKRWNAWVLRSSGASRQSHAQ